MFFTRCYDVGRGWEDESCGFLRGLVEFVALGSKEILVVRCIVLLARFRLYGTAQRKRRRSDPFAESFFPFETGDLNAASWSLYRVVLKVVGLAISRHGVGEAVIDFDSGLFAEGKCYLEAQSAEKISVLIAAFWRRAKKA